MQFFPSRAIALTVGPVSVHWYGIMYLLGFVIGMYLLPRLQRFRDLALSDAQRESLVVHVFLGVLLGGRLGYVFFYDFPYFFQHPFDVIAVWKGGMASHGGFVGVILALVLFARRQGIPLLRLTDVLMVPVAIGLALGRVGNFINLELYGTVTTVPWAMAFPGAEGLRHPTQLYAVCKDLLIALLCFWHLRSTVRMPHRAGETSALFLVLYGILRFVVEHFSDQPYGFVQLLGFSLSRGQVLTLPVLALGIIVWVWVRFSPRRYFV
jgi:phosphatidylglycerol:prolipoprotein diacylglycerol transferase